MINLDTQMAAVNPPSTMLPLPGQLDITDTNQLLQQQMLYMQYSAKIAYDSTIIRLYKDMVMGIIAKI